MISGSIVAKRLSVAKEKTDILKSLSFSVEQGTVTGLIGPSGSGKTTLMRAIVGVQVPTSGSLTVLDFPAGDARLRSSIGYVTQDPSVYDDLTVLQNLRYFARLVGSQERDIVRILHEVDLMRQKNQLVASLSGGQRARVSLAIALLGDPDVLILDEPTVGLDPVLRIRLWKLFHHLAKQGRTLLVSSHVMDEADRCDHLMLMRDGRLIYAGTRKDLLKKAHARSVETAFISLVEGKS